MGFTELLKNALFPKVCYGCGKLGVYICPTCVAKLAPVRGDQCPYCQKASYFGLTHPSCTGASRLDGLKSFYYYSPLTRKIIKGIKYRLVKDAMPDFMHTIMLDKIVDLFFYKKITTQIVIIPVPLHTKRLARRGFNQSVDIALFFSEKLGIKMDVASIERSRNTPPQASLKTPYDRYRNIHGAFAVIKNSEEVIKNNDFIIVDDVWTTGSTIKEMCRVLKKNGARKVFALTLVR